MLRLFNSGQIWSMSLSLTAMRGSWEMSQKSSLMSGLGEAQFFKKWSPRLKIWLWNQPSRGWTKSFSHLTSCRIWLRILGKMNSRQIFRILITILSVLKSHPPTIKLRWTNFTLSLPTSLRATKNSTERSLFSILFEHWSTRKLPHQSFKNSFKIRME